MAIPNIAPNRPGNVGPRKYAVSQYGTAKETHANSVSGSTSSAGLIERSSPKNRVIIATPIKGSRMPTTTWWVAAHTPISAIQPSTDIPCPATAPEIDSEDSKMSCRPMISGVPTAPNVMAIRFPVSATTTAASGGNPSPTSSGPTMAAGVPKPAADSMNDPIRNTSNTTCTRRSSLIDVKPALMTSNAPVCLSVYRSKIAPNTIHRMLTAVMAPLIDAAAIQRGDMLQPAKPTAAATTHATGIARVAGQYRPIMRNEMTASGSTPMTICAIVAIRATPCRWRPHRFVCYAVLNMPVVLA